MSATSAERAVTFTPGLAGLDEAANYWLLQASLRLRREVCWRWHLRDDAPLHADALPPLGSPLMVSLDLARHARAKAEFFRRDVTARYLSDQIATAEPTAADCAHGSFGWVAQQLALTPVARFALGLGASAAFDGSVGPVIAACLDDGARTTPTLGLVQRLWDDPSEVMQLADPWHALWRHGLLQASAPLSPDDGSIGWMQAFTAPALIARRLLFPATPLPDMLSSLDPTSSRQPTGHAVGEFQSAIARLRSGDPHALRVVPVLGARSASAADAVARVADTLGRPVCHVTSRALTSAGGAALRQLAVLCWLSGHDLLLADADAGAHADDSTTLALSSLRGLPLIVYVTVGDAASVAALPRDLVQPALCVTGLDHAARVRLWRALLGKRGLALGDAVDECARRFRYDRERITAIAHALRAEPGPMTKERLIASCRADMVIDLGYLAQEVKPRFSEGELVLPPRQRAQFDDVARAMLALTAVHYEWGMGRPWNESGISVLFAGPPGTGKTMAAEILSATLDIPMYRVDLSQVVNKYIGETEKNLKRVFDVADTADAILFFDECDALFGRRTEVRDAHDRYANVEISYLLERMERFKGLAILATNRQKDIDEAFRRRLRYIVEFPMPDVRERHSLWTTMLPPGVDARDVDVDFLARQFPLAGGHIRSIILNACLQSAGGSPGTQPRLTMERVIVAVQREYDKLGRSVTLEQFGPHAPALRAVAHA